MKRNELEVEGIDQWMKLVENKGWLSRTLRSSGAAGSEGEDTAKQYIINVRKEVGEY